MFHRLHGRQTIKGRAVRGLSCDESGLYFGGDCALVTADGEGFYRVRPVDEINRALSAGYGAPIDFSRKMATLNRIADLMTAGDWGLAQITALQMGLPELPDDEAVERLLKADDLLRFNPNHKPPGPGGGQFTTGSDGGSGAGQSGDAGHQAQLATHKEIPTLSYKTVSGAANTRSWGTLWHLSKPSVLGGYIIQKNETLYVFGPKYTGTAPTFWEAFRVSPGSNHTVWAHSGAMGGGDDWWGGTVGLPGSHGVQIETSSTRFYEGLSRKELGPVDKVPDPKSSPPSTATSTPCETWSNAASQSSSTAADWPPDTTRPPTATSASSSSQRPDFGSGTLSTGPRT